MANINVRGLPDATKEALGVRAAQMGLSLEDYVRHILQKASTISEPEPRPVTELAKKYFGKKHGVELELPNRSTHREPIDFG